MFVRAWVFGRAPWYLAFKSVARKKSRQPNFAVSGRFTRNSLSQTVCDTSLSAAGFSSRLKSELFAGAYVYGEQLVVNRKIVQIQICIIVLCCITK